MYSMEGFLLRISFHIIRFKTRKWLVFCCLCYDYFAINSYQWQIFSPHSFYLWACKRLINTTFYCSRCPVYILFVITLHKLSTSLDNSLCWANICSCVCFYIWNMVCTSYWLADSVFEKTAFLIFIQRRRGVFPNT